MSQTKMKVNHLKHFHASLTKNKIFIPKLKRDKNNSQKYIWEETWQLPDIKNI